VHRPPLPRLRQIPVQIAQYQQEPAQGFRVVAHDRRGHGRSTQVSEGHDMDHYASDASAVAEHLNLKNAAHIACG
jgi:pimeloyl-ACP methyl ester carboxylesterase